MATLTPQFFELLEADQKEIFFKQFSMIPELWSQLMETKNSTRGYEDRMRVAGFGTLALKPEGTPIAFDDPVQGTRVRTVHSTYGLGWRASMEMMQDDQHSIMNRMSSDLADSAKDHRERLAWSMIDDAFTGTTFTGLEGDAMLIATHTPVRGGSDQSNLLSPAVALGVTGLEAMMTLARTTVSEEGRFLNLPQSTLVIPPQLEHQAHELLNTEFQIDSNNNNVSTVATSRNGITPLIVPYLSSTSAWTLHAPKGQNGLCWNDRMGVEFTSAGDAVTKDMQNFVCYRASVMFSEWRGNFGSNF